MTAAPISVTEFFTYDLAMAHGATTCWEMIEAAARGDAGRRDEFVRRYTPMVRDYLGARWRGTPLLDELDDAQADVFLESFRSGGVLEQADSTRPGGFRAFFHGVMRNVARRIEDARVRNREYQASTSFDPDARKIAEASLSQIVDRAWARTVLDEAGLRHYRSAVSQGDAALRRVELLRLRFADELPIREIAERIHMDADKAHQEYRRARREFRRCVEAELLFQGATEDDLEAQWGELISLLG